MDKQQVSVVVTDIDNTLYDQVKAWYAAFNPLLASLQATSGATRELLVSEIKAAHTQFRTSEYAFLLKELKCLTGEPPRDLGKDYAAAINAYRAAGVSHLKLYPAVKETLEAIKAQGALVVAYTEAQGLYAEHRVRTLGLDGVIDYLYSSPSHALPEDPDNLSLHPAAFEKLKATRHEYTPSDVHKPSPVVLNTIVAGLKVPKREVIYVGDKKSRDVSMAQSAGVTDVHAAYGEAHDRPEYGLLREVTHWTPEEVAREAAEAATITPSVTLHNSFSELLALFEFVPYTGADAGVKLPAAMLPHYLDTWKKTIEVQQHFNDLGLRIRNFAITVLGALLGIAALTLKDGIKVTLGRLTVPAAAALTFVAIITWLAFYLMDRFWYHELLLASVKHGNNVETRLRTTLPTIGLTGTIGQEFSEDKSNKRMNQFYLIVFGALVLLIMLLSVSMGSWRPAAGGATPAGNGNSANQNGGAPPRNDNAANLNGNAANGNAANGNAAGQGVHR